MVLKVVKIFEKNFNIWFWIEPGRPPQSYTLCRSTARFTELHRTCTEYKLWARSIARSTAASVPCLLALAGRQSKFKWTLSSGRSTVWSTDDNGYILAWSRSTARSTAKVSETLQITFNGYFAGFNLVWLVSNGYFGIEWLYLVSL